MNCGTITSINLERGFGFIRPAGKGADVFFHFSTLQGGLAFDETLRHARVEFIVEEGPKGPRSKAVYPASN